MHEALSLFRIRVLISLSCMISFPSRSSGFFAGERPRPLRAGLPAQADAGGTLHAAAARGTGLRVRS